MLRFAVIGCGRTAPKHVGNLTGGLIKEAGLSAVCDHKPERAKVFGKKYKVNPPNVYGFDHTEYLNDVGRAIKTGKNALVQGFEGRRSLELVTAIDESIETGKEVQVRFSPKQRRLGLKT